MERELIPDLDEILSQVKTERAKEAIEGELYPIVFDYTTQNKNHINEQHYKSILDNLLSCNKDFIDLIITGSFDITKLKDTLRTQYSIISTAPLDGSSKIPVAERQYITYFLLKRKDLQDIIEPLPTEIATDLSLSSRYDNDNPYKQKKNED